MGEGAATFPPDDFAGRLVHGAAMPLGLQRTDENTAEIAALGELLGAPIGLEGLLGQLKWRLRPSLSGRLLGRAVRRAWRFDRFDQADRRWWPQGMACAPQEWNTGRDVVATTWYSKTVQGTGHGARLTFTDLQSGRYRHVLLVDPVLREGRLELRPLHVHAGGLAWVGNTLHVAATGRGFFSFDLRDVMRVHDSHLSPEAFGIDEDHRVSSYGHRFVLPVRAAWRATTAAGAEKLRYSFLSVDSASPVPALLAGEYGRGEQSTRLARFPLDVATGAPRAGADGQVRPSVVDLRGEPQMQGVAKAAGRLYVSVSQGPWKPGTALVGQPGAFARHARAFPMGPEDLDHRASDDTLWTVTEHPWRRWIVQAPRSWFDR